MSDYAELRAFAEDLAESARSVCLPYFRSALEVTAKSDQSPVTRADRETEEHLRARIAARYPDAGVFGEEGGISKADAEIVWVLDPVDGTKSFITGYPTFGTLIAAVHNGRPVVGVIDMPALDERWTGVAGQPTSYRWGEQTIPARTRACQTIAESVVSTTSTDMFESDDLAVFDRLSRQAWLRRFGGDCYQYGRLASGGLDLVLEASLKPYDYLALVPVVEGAGGVVTDWDGRPLDFASDGRVLAASSRALHHSAMVLMNGQNIA